MTKQTRRRTAKKNRPAPRNRNDLNVGPSSWSEETVINVMTSRQEFFRKLFDPRRDIEDECGHTPLDKTINPEEFQRLYERDAIGARIIKVMPKESWQVQPTVFEDDNPTVVTPFEEVWDSLGQQLRGETSYYRGEEGSPVWEYLRRADQLCGIGRYGVILLGIKDGKPMSEPVTPIREGEELRQLLYIRCLPESMAEIAQYETDVTNPRFGQPTRYTITLFDPRKGMTAPLPGQQSYDVHWTRIVHIVDNLDTSEVLGVERMRAVIDRVKDLRKLYGGSAEMYWKGAFPGISLETHPALGGDVDLDRPGLRDMMESYMNGLQRYLALMGMSAKTLSPQVVDPRSQIDVQIEAICIDLGIPKRVFMGSERGELASAQDDAAWNDRLRERQRTHITPRVIVPFVDRLIAVGVLPVPSGKRQRRKFSRGTSNLGMVRKVIDGQPGTVLESSGYSVWWPDLTSQTTQEKSQVAFQRTQALTQYAGSPAPLIFPPLDYFSRILGISEDEAVAVLENARKEGWDGKLPLTLPETESSAKQAESVAKADKSVGKQTGEKA